jgi:hypothetical protein
MIARGMRRHPFRGLRPRCAARAVYLTTNTPMTGPADAVETRPVKQGSADDAAFIMQNAGKVIIAETTWPIEDFD